MSKKDEDYKQKLQDFWYSDFMQSVNPKPSLEEIEKLKEEYLKKREKGRK